MGRCPRPESRRGLSSRTVPTCILRVICPDQPGLVAAVANFVADHGGNIIHADQHHDESTSIFFQLVQFDLEGFPLPRHEIGPAFAPVAERFGMSVDVRFCDERPRIAIMASKAPHCLTELLSDWRAGEIQADVALIVSNVPDHADLATFYGIPFHHLPVTPETKAAQEARLLELLDQADVELVVLARYMQILSPTIVDRYPNRIINIHHSFLPAFAGARPYHQAHERGVKLIGATAHYVTADLDQGPIIEQDVVRVSHRKTVQDLTRRGSELEKIVLARALRYHLEHRILVFGNKTVVFT